MSSATGFSSIYLLILHVGEEGIFINWHICVSCHKHTVFFSLFLNLLRFLYLLSQLLTLPFTYLRTWDVSHFSLPGRLFCIHVLPYDSGRNAIAPSGAGPSAWALDPTPSCLLSERSVLPLSPPFFLLPVFLPLAQSLNSITMFFQI